MSRCTQRRDQRGPLVRTSSSAPRHDDNGRAGYWALTCTGTTWRSLIPRKSSTLMVCRGRSCVIAIAAICRSLVRVRDVRPAASTSATTRAEHSRRVGVVRQDRLGEGGLDDLEAKLAHGALVGVGSGQRSDAQLTEGDRRDPLLLRQVIRTEPLSAELDDNAGVEQSRLDAHRSRGRVQPWIDELVELLPEALVVIATNPSEGVEHVGLARRTTFRLVWDEVGDRNTTIGDHDRLAGLSTPPSGCCWHCSTAAGWHPSCRPYRM